MIASEKYKYQQLLTTLKGNDVVVTATQRLAAFLEREYAVVKSDEGKEVWVKPAIFSFPTWLKRSWGTTRFFSQMLLLSEWQERALWQKVIEDSGELLIGVESAAKLAREALNLVQEWRLPFPFPGGMISEDMQMFQRWAVLFQARCCENHWLTLSELPRYLSQQFQVGKLRPPNRIVLMGFSEINQTYQELLQTLKDLGTQVEYYEDAFKANQVNRLELDTIDAEILTMARWAKATLQACPSGHLIGCIVPQLEQRRSIVLQTFRSVFADSDFSFALSAPTRFDKISLIHIAFKLLTLGEKRIDLVDSGLLLKTPFIDGAQTERVARARLDVELRQLANDNVSIDSLLQLAGEENKPFYCPGWRQRVINFRSLLMEAATQRFLPSTFAEKFIECLNGLGWPGERLLTADETQIVQRFQQALKEFSSLDVICGEMSWEQARLQLEGMMKQILFQPKLNEFAPVQILGTLEPVGLLFTHLWVLGLNDELWPSAPQPNPLIPLSLQCQFDIPHSSAMRELKFSQYLTQQFCQMAPEVIFSSAKQDKDIQLRASPLLNEFPAIDVSVLHLTENLSSAITSTSMESLEDDYAPAIPFGERIRGGAYLFELQSACPFRAFAQVRLCAKALEKHRGFLSAKEKGTLLHRALELVWETLKSQHRLLEASEEAIHTLVLSSVKTAMAELYEGRLDELLSGFNQIEERRLVNLIEKWLYWQEKPRSAFKIGALELSEQIELLGYQFRLKMDRVDELCANGKQIIIDYKSGLVSEKDWLGERPDKPQLPLYCVTSKTPVSGVLFAQLKTGQLKFKGLVEEGIEIDGAKVLSNEEWLNQQAEWKMDMENLVQQFTQGYAKVDPKEGQKTCRFCELKGFCRVGEES